MKIHDGIILGITIYWHIAMPIRNISQPMYAWHYPIFSKDCMSVIRPLLNIWDNDNMVSYNHSMYKCKDIKR